MDASNEAPQAVPSTTEYGTEADLVDALRRRDRAACAGLVRQYMPRLYGLALRVTGNPEDAEDVMQESFIQACNHLDNFEGRSGLSTWLHRIVLNAALMQLRKRGPVSGLHPEWDESRTAQVSAQRVGAAGAGDPSTDRVLSQVLSQELRETIDRAILLLPDALRAAIVLRDVEGLSTAETAQALGITESACTARGWPCAVRSRLIWRGMKAPHEERKDEHHGIADRMSRTAAAGERIRRGGCGTAGHCTD